MPDTDTQGVASRPIVAAQQDDGGLVERMTGYAQFLDASHSPNGAVICRQAATALAEKAARIAELEAQSCDPDGCKAHIDAFMERAFKAERERDEARAECEGLRAALEDSLPAMNATERLASIKAAGYPRSEEEMLHRIIDNFLDKRRAALSQKEPSA